MIKKFLALWLLGFVAESLWAQQVPQAQYFRPFASGASEYKIAALKTLASPHVSLNAAQWTSDERVQELAALAQANDILLYDGLRLVRYRGALVTEGPIDEKAVARAVLSFNVEPQEAQAWLLASRLLQMTGYKDDGAALSALENDLIATGADLYLRLATYVGPQKALSCMPRLARLWGYRLTESEVNPMKPTENASGYTLIRMPR